MASNYFESGTSGLRERGGERNGPAVDGALGRLHRVDAVFTCAKSLAGFYRNDRFQEWAGWPLFGETGEFEAFQMDPDTYVERDLLTGNTNISASYIGFEDWPRLPNAVLETVEGAIGGEATETLSADETEGEARRVILQGGLVGARYARNDIVIKHVHWVADAEAMPPTLIQPGFYKIEGGGVPDIAPAVWQYVRREEFERFGNFYVMSDRFRSRMLYMRGTFPWAADIDKGVPVKMTGLTKDLTFYDQLIANHIALTNGLPVRLIVRSRG